MKNIIYPLFCFFVSIFFLACTETNNKNEEKAKPKEEDSLKVFFYNFNKKKLDSLNPIISNEILTTRGINMEKFLINVPQRDSLSYEYYAQYVYWLSFKHRYIEAINYLNLASKVVKNKSRYYFDKACAWAYIEPLHQRDSVYFYINKAIKEDSLNAFYYYARSRFYNEDDNNENIIKDINMSIKLEPKDTSYINQRGFYKIILEDYNGGLKDLEYIAHINKNNANVYMIKAIAYNKLKKHKEALQAANECININDKIAIVYTIRGNARYVLGAEEAGINDIRKGAALGDKDAIELIRKYDDFHRTNKTL